MSRSSEKFMENSKEILNNIIYIDDGKTETDKNKVFDNILSGMTVIILSWEPDI